MKLCTKCLVKKLDTEFYPVSHGGTITRSACKKCMNMGAKSQRDSNPDRGKNRHLVYKYGISLEQKLGMIKDQNNLCLICSNDLTSLTEMARGVDHDHSTGRIRGVLCRSCNTKLGWFEPRQRIILEYLKRGK
jgi:hypothetical protein